MKIGIVGSEGIVGNAMRFMFEMVGGKVFSYDLRLKKSKLKDVLNGEVIFICVPSPMNPDGSCNISIVEQVLKDLKELCEYDMIHRIIVIKSTIPPPELISLFQKYNNSSYIKLCYNPEFLKERSAIIDATERHDLCVIGTEDKEVFEEVKKCYGNVPKHIVQTTPYEASMIKYMNNAWGAMIVTYANAFYELCNKLNIDYSKCKDALVKRENIPDNYLVCNENFRGFGGMCWPKDLNALAHICKDLNIEFFKNILEENKKYKTTVYPGMRN